jgi:hypothetical protein
MRSLEDIRLSIKAPFCYEKALYSYIADHAHCAIKLLWQRYADKSSDHALDYALESFNVHFWRWESITPYPDEYGQSRNARITTVVFESTRQNKQLIIRARNKGTVIETRYNETRVWEGEYTNRMRTSYVLDQTVPQVVPAQPFILSGKFHRALGSLFEQRPILGVRRRIARWAG